MKKFSKLFLALVLIIGLTGCAKYNVNMEVKDDKSVTLEIIYGMNVDTDDSVSTENYTYLEELGYKVEKFEETKDDTTTGGVKITKKFKNIDDITADKKVTVDLVQSFEEKNKDKLKDLKFFYKDGNNYVANFVFDFIGNDEDRDTSMDSVITDLKYTIKLPVETIENNASKVSEDGKELTWDLVYSKANEVNFSFALNGGFNWTIVIAAVAAVAVLVVVLLLLTKKKKPAQGQPMMNNAQPMNQGNVPVQPEVVQQPAVQPEVVQQPVAQPEAVSGPTEEVKPDNNNLI